MFCPNCGRELSEGALFCPNCGIKINPIKNDGANKVKSFNNVSENDLKKNSNDDKTINNAVFQNSTTNNPNNNNIQNKKNNTTKSNKLIFPFSIILLIIGIAFALFKFVLPNLNISSISLPKVSNLLPSKKVNKNPVYYIKNDKLYDSEGDEEQEPIEKNVSSNLYYNKNTKEYYFVKNEKICKIIKDETENIHNGFSINYVTKSGCIFANEDDYYLYNGKDTIKIGPYCYYDVDNDKIYAKKDDVCYIISDEGEKEKIASNVNDVYFLQGRGFIYNNDNGIYLYKNGESKKIADNTFFIAPDEMNTNILYLYKSKPLNIVDFINFNVDDKNYESVKESLKSANNKYYTSDIYAYDVNSDEMVLLMENTNFALNEFLVCNKPIGMMDIDRKIDYNNIQFNSYESSSETINNAVKKNVFICDTNINYLFVGTDRTLIQLGDNKYTTYSPFIQFDDGYVSALINGDKNGELYYGKVNLNDVSKLDLIDNNVSYAVDISSKGIYYRTLDDRLMYYNGKNSKEIDDGVHNHILKDDKLYLLSNWDYEANYGSLNRVDLNTGEKEKIENRVQSLASCITNFEFYKPFEEIKIDSNFDGSKFYFNENNLLDDYEKKYLRIGWYVDKNDNNKKIYYDLNHNKIVNNYQQIDNEIYYFDEDGYMIYDGWQGDYYFGSDGKMQKDKWIDGYYVGSDGRYVKNTWIGLNYLDSSGLKAKNKWIGDYYVDANGQMLVNSWIDGYYVGADGRYLKNAWVGKSYVGPSGKKVVNAWVGDYYLGADGNYVINTVVDGKNIGADGRVVITNNTSTGYPTSGTTTGGNNTSGTGTNETSGKSVGMYTAGPNGETLHIFENVKIKEEVEGDDDRICKITGLKPTIGGVNKDEVNCINDFIDDQFETIMEDLISMAQSTSPVPRTITMSKNEITSLTSKRMRITLTGKLTPKSGTSKSVKFRITYDRDEEDGTIENLTSE